MRSDRKLNQDHLGKPAVAPTWPDERVEPAPETELTSREAVGEPRRVGGQKGTRLDSERMKDEYDPIHSARPVHLNSNSRDRLKPGLQRRPIRGCWQQDSAG